MKRIHCFTESLAGGGAEHQISILADLLSERGYDVSVVTYADAEDHYPLSQKVHRIKLGQGKSGVGKVLSIFIFFIRVKTDCVISYRTNCNTRILLPMLFRGKSVNVICSERGYTKGKASRFERINTRLLYYRANHIVTNCHAQRLNLAVYKRKWCGRLTTIINYTDTEHYKALLQPSFDGKIKIGVFANFSIWKNWERLAEVVKRLKEEGLKNYVIHWYGNIKGGPQNYAKFKELISQYGIEEYIVVYDAVKDTAEYMPRYNVICHPSITEGFSNTICEAICCGRMVIAGDVSDNGTMARPDENGILFDPLSIESMTEAFRQLLSMSNEEIEKCGKRSRKIAEDLFQKEKFINSYIDLIEQNGPKE